MTITTEEQKYLDDLKARFDSQKPSKQVKKAEENLLTALKAKFDLTPGQTTEKEISDVIDQELKYATGEAKRESTVAGAADKTATQVKQKSSGGLFGKIAKATGADKIVDGVKDVANAGKEVTGVVDAREVEALKKAFDKKELLDLAKKDIPQEAAKTTEPAKTDSTTKAPTTTPAAVTLPAGVEAGSLEALIYQAAHKDGNNVLTLTELKALVTSDEFIQAARKVTHNNPTIAVSNDKTKADDDKIYIYNGRDDKKTVHLKDLNITFDNEVQSGDLQKPMGGYKLSTEKGGR